LNDAANVIGSLVNSLISSQKELQNEAESIGKSAAQTFDLIRGFDEVNKGINGAAVFAQQLNGISNAGAENMNKLSSSMQKVQESSQEILKITGVLDDFAERTNLLAMNASIEAAHAGEAGKGFSVVANEIKNLAAASSQQSAKIAEIVTEVAQAIGEGVGLCKLVNNSLSKIKEESNVTAEQVKNSAEQMSEKQREGYKIAEESKIVAGYANQMRQSAQSQTEYSEKVKDGMQALMQVSATVEEAAASIYKSNEALSVQVEQLKELASSAEKTADQLTLMMK
ncbi:MAG: methyl-accepting chemotaxis protein, partial [Treponemataceae bacterium]|nr:methyl-accepting chemotaxis protein [Treponemataceae bacterium]